LLKMLRQRIQDDKGFTLIELMVVVLIIAILIAIAIPTFLGLRQRAQDRAAQSELRNGLTAAKAFYTDGETYVGFTAAVGEETEPSLNWATGGAASENTVHIVVVNSQELVLKTTSESAQDFCIADSTVDPDGAGALSAGTALGDDDATTFATCNGGW
jgi:type IV pilus assembly protein PilA